MAYVRSGSQQPTGNAVAGDVKAGKTFSNENDVDIVGTLALSGDAAVGNVLSGKTFYNNSWTKQTGTMTNNGAVSPSGLNCGGSYTIPAGYHNGSGKVKANSLSSQTAPASGKSAVTAATMLTGYSGWVNGSQINGTMANQGTKTYTINPGGSQTIPAGYHNGSGKVTANPNQNSTTFTPTSSQYNSSQAEMGVNNTHRYVNTSVCYNAGIVHESNNRSQYFSSVLREPNDEFRIDLYSIKAGTSIKLWTTNATKCLCNIYDSNENVIRAQWNFSSSQGIDAYTFPSDGNYIIRLRKLDPYYEGTQAEGTNFWAWYQLTNSNY